MAQYNWNEQTMNDWSNQKDVKIRLLLLYNIKLQNSVIKDNIE